jgi:iron(III) transport system permease protein
VALGLVLPVSFLVWEVIGRDLGRTLDATFLRHLAVTLGLAATATGLILAVATGVSLSTRTTPGRLGAVLAFLSGLGYAVPGAILALGLLAPLVFLDGALAALGGSPGPVLFGSMGGLLLAYLIRFLRVASGPLSAQLESGGGQLESAARVLGAGPWALARHVQLPLMRPALGAAALLVFIDCVKELPVTVLLRPLNVETMATLVYGAAARGSFADGALAALAIVAACILPVAWLTHITRPGSVRARALEAAPA